MAKFRVFQVTGRKLSLVEDLETRKRDLKNWAVTLRDLEDGAVYTYFQSRRIRERIRNQPLSVKIYNTPREILESMLRAAVSDAVIDEVFDFSRSAARKRSTHSETRTLRAIATQAALSTYGKTFRAKIEGDGILLIMVLNREFGSREAEEYSDIVFEKLRDLFKSVVVDIREVMYMNSSGISVLARTASDVPTRIVGASEPVRSVMDLMGLLPLLNLDDTQEDAFTRLREGEPGEGEG
jgi:anti-anti-sigma factor